MRIIAGMHRGRKLTPPEGDTIRPSSARTREALFNILMHGAFAGAAVRGQRVADICSGTGALGLEALSRGASHCSFVDHAQASISLAKKNAAHLGVLEQCDFTQADATKLPPAGAPFALIMMDPPYSKGLVPGMVQSLLAQGWAQTGSILTTEIPFNMDVPPLAGMELKTERKYGKTKLLVWVVI
jgi:16S rRNA (guanine966-N2)-methyltransferase